MIFAALDESAVRGELLFVDGGMIRWHRRRDGVTVVREVIVLPRRRRNGIATRLVAAANAASPGPMLAKCPEGAEANRFWAALGWEDGGLDPAARTPVRRWTRPR